MHFLRLHHLYILGRECMRVEDTDDKIVQFRCDGLVADDEGVQVGRGGILYAIPARVRLTLTFSDPEQSWQFARSCSGCGMTGEVLMCSVCPDTAPLSSFLPISIPVDFIARVQSCNALSADE